MKRKFDQAGDTIVEVLVSMAVISLILAGAYVLVNHTTLNELRAQERGVALQLVQGQLEALHGCAVTAGSCTMAGRAFNPDSPGFSQFCMFNSTQAVIMPNSECNVNASGQPTTTEPMYKLSITPNSPSANVFSAQANWDQVGGGGTENVTLDYKVK